MTWLKSRPNLSSGSRGILLIASGTAGGQVVGLFVAPVLTRVYSPADLGLFTVVFALVSTVATVAALRLELAVPIPRDDDDARSVVVLGLIAAAISAVIGTATVALVGRSAAEAYGQPDLARWLWLVPITAAITGAFLVLNQLAVRQRRYASISKRNLIQSITMAAVQVGAGVAGLRPGGLVLGLGVAQAAGATSLLFGSGLTPTALRTAAHGDQLRKVLSRFRRFPLVLAPSGLINVLGIQFPVLLISFAYGPEVTGWLGLSQRVLAIPVALIGTAVAQVYIGELATVVREDPARAIHLFVQTSRRLALAALLIASTVVALGPWAFGLVFGAEWTQSGQFARVLAVGLAAQLVAVPLSQTLIVFERIYLQFMWDVGRLCVTGAATLSCAAFGGSPQQAVLSFAIASAVAYGLSWLLSWRTVSRTSRRCATSS